jgi:pimeloyl-ACP methyl ester carboxylesterase
MPEVAAWQTAALHATAMEDWWDACAPQVLVVQGLADAVAPPENGRAYVQDHADVARLVEIPDAGHALMVEQPDYVGRAVVTFLLDVDGTGHTPGQR